MHYIDSNSDHYEKVTMIHEEDKKEKPKKVN
jgi:hypothetical protein